MTDFESYVCSYGVYNCPICVPNRAKKAQSTAQIAAKTKKVTEAVAKAIASGRVKPKISPTGGITFTGLTDLERSGLTDEVIYRNLIKSKPSGLVAAAFERAEAMAGRKVSADITKHVSYALTGAAGRNTQTQGGS